jgi:FKBP-type peptidyl-prolyl cis-trans isomerase (trigger factor)
MMMRLRLPEIFFYDKEFMAQAKVSGADLDSDFAAAQSSQERINENYLKQASQRVNATLNWDPYLRLFDKVPQEKLFEQIVALHIDTDKPGVHKDLVESKINTANRDLYIKGVTTFIMSTPQYQLG